MTSIIMAFILSLTEELMEKDLISKEELREKFKVVREKVPYHQEMSDTDEEVLKLLGLDS